jgi:dethiobiotin synthetase
MARGLFVTGTDTDVGKTHDCPPDAFSQGSGAERDRNEGGGLGAERVDERWVNEDALALQKESSIPIEYELFNRFLFESPVSLHLVAKDEVADLALKLKLPVLQVLGIGFGCINHAASCRSP